MDDESLEPSTPVPESIASSPARRPRHLLDLVLRRWWIVAAVLAIVLVISVFLAQFRVPVWSVRSQIILESGGTSPASTAGNSSLNLDAEAEHLRSTRTLATALGLEGVADLPSLQGADSRLDMLRRNLKVTADKSDDTLTILYRSPSRTDATAIANAIVRAYQIVSSSQARSPAAEALRKFEQERAKSEEEVREKTQALMEFKQRNRIVSTDSKQTTPLIQRLADLSEALSATHLQTLNAKSACDEVQGRLKNDPRKLAVYDRIKEKGGMVLLAGDEAQLLTDIQQLQRRQKDLSQRYLPNHPVIQSIQGDIDQREATYVLVVEQRYQRAQQHEQDLQKSLDELQKQVLDLQQQQLEYAGLEDALNRTRDVANGIASQIGKLPSAEETPPLSIMVAEPARAEAASLVNSKSATIYQGIILGLVLGIAATFLDRRYRSVDEVAASLSLPILSSIPHTHGKQSDSVRGRKVQLDPASEVADAYRAVRTGVYFGAPLAEARTILVTSPSRGEGKSTLASNLAIAMAQAGQRTLILDADFRMPMQHRIFQVDDTAGLSTVLAGRRSLEGTIQKTGIKDLDILPAGPVPPNPADIFNNRAFEQMLKGLSERLGYQQIVLDSPAVMPNPDAKVLAAMCDQTLLTVRARKSSRRAAILARDALVSVGATIMGVVINDVLRGRIRLGSSTSSTSSTTYRGQQLRAAASPAKLITSLPSTKETAKALAAKLKAITTNK